MKIILLCNKDKKLLKILSSIKLMNCRMVMLENPDFLEHYIEEYLPSYIILDPSSKNVSDLLIFLKNYPEIRLLLTSDASRANCDKGFDDLNSKKSSPLHYSFGDILLKIGSGKEDFKRLITTIDKIENFKNTDKSIFDDFTFDETCKFINQQLISFYSIQGGTGRTTVALNLAWILKSLCNIKILYLDLNFSQGPSDMSLKMNFPLTPNLGFFIEKKGADKSAFTGSVLKIKNLNIDFIQPPAALHQSDKFDTDMLNELIYKARNEYNMIFTDIPYRYENVDLEMLNISTCVYFIASPEISQIRRINEFQKILSPAQKKGIIINESRSYRTCSIKELKKISAIPLLKYIPYIGGNNIDYLELDGNKTEIIDIRSEIKDLAVSVISA